MRLRTMFVNGPREGEHHEVPGAGQKHDEPPRAIEVLEYPGPGPFMDPETGAVRGPVLKPVTHSYELIGRSLDSEVWLYRVGGLHGEESTSPRARLAALGAYDDAKGADR